jgi:hypothetical protein
MPMSFDDDPAKRNVPSVTKSRRGQTSRRYELLQLQPAGIQRLLRSEQLNDQDIWFILEEAETGQRPEWKDIADRRPTYKSYCAQWKFLAVRNGILERHWESTDGRSEVTHIVLPQSKE